MDKFSNPSSLASTFKQLTLGVKLGEGGFGVVYKATYQGDTYAVKQLHKTKHNEAGKAAFLKEIANMAKLRSQYIVSIFNGISTEPYTIVMEYMAKGSLYDLLKDKSMPLEWPLRYSISLDIAKGINFLHSENIIHRNLKSFNVLLDDKLRAKLCDFGLAQLLEESGHVTTELAISLPWTAPELLDDQPASFASDIYAYGMVLWEIAARQVPFADVKSKLAIMHKIAKGEWEKMPINTPPLFQQAINAAWQPAPEQRPNALTLIEQIEKSRQQPVEQVLNPPAVTSGSGQTNSMEPHSAMEAQAVKTTKQDVTIPESQPFSSISALIANLTTLNINKVSQPPPPLPIPVPSLVRIQLPDIPLEALPPTMGGSQMYLDASKMYFHDKQIVHRDLKSFNVLLDKNYQPKTTDSGSGKPLENNGQMTLGEPGSLPRTVPALLNHKPASFTAPSALPPVNDQATSEAVVKAATAMLRAKAWSNEQKAYFEELIQTMSLPPMQTLQEHIYAVNTLLLLPNGLLASGSSDNTIKLWDLDSGTCKKTLQGHTKSVLTLRLLPDGLLASGSWDNTIKLWDLDSGTCKKTLQGHTNHVATLLVLPNGQLASGAWDNTIKCWDLTSGTCKKTLQGHTDFVNTLLVLPNGLLASGSDDNTIKLWDLDSGTCKHTLQGHTDAVNTLLMLPNGQLASGSQDHTLKLWNFTSKQCLKTLTAQHPVKALRLLGNARLLFSTGHEIQCWRLDNWLCEQRYGGLTGGYIWDLLPLSSTECLAASGPQIQRFSLAPTTTLREALTGPRQGLSKTGHYGFFKHQALSQLKRVPKTLVGPKNTVKTLLMLPNGQLATGSSDTTSKLWEPDLTLTFEELEQKAPECKMM